MTNYVVGSDNIDGKEQSYIDTISQVLEEAGNTCEKRPVGPGYVQGYGLGNGSSGKTAVFIVGGSDGGTYQDLVQGISRGYYHYDLCWFAFASWTRTEWITESDLKSRPLVRAHDDNFSTDTSGFVGKTAAQYFSENSQYIKMAYGDTPEEVAKMILNGGGDTSDDEGGSSASTIKDALKELLSFWDAEVECYLRGDTVYVHKIPAPRESCELELKQGVNINLDSISITDYNPDTINVMTVHSEVMDDLVYREDKLIWRFGEKPVELDAVKYVTVTTTEEVESTDTSTEDTSTDTTDDTSEDSTDTTDSDDTTEEETTTTETKTVTKVEEVPCETPEEVEAFADKEWAKIKRDNGHSIECKVQGAPQWRAGEWVKINIPLFDEDGYMYIKSVSQSMGDTWECSLSLVDYPPGFGEYTPDTSDEEETTDEETEETTDDTSTDEESA